METKNCHVVQQAYLKFFASDMDKTKIWQFNKKDDPIEKSIKNVAKIDYFYPQWLEHYIDYFYENEGVNALRSLVEKGSFYDLDPKEKRIVCDWIYIQFIRTPKFEEDIANFLNIYCNQQIDEIPHKYKDQFKGAKFDIRHVPELYMLVKNDLWSYMVNKENNFFYHMIESKVWEVVSNRTSKTYYTSDNPVVITCGGERASFFQADLLTLDNDDYFALKLRKLRPHEDVAFYLPLTPSLMLTIHRLQDKYCSQLAQDIGKINAAIALQSSCVFSCTNDFDDARNYEKYYKQIPMQNAHFYVQKRNEKEITPINIDALLSTFEKRLVSTDSTAIFGGTVTDIDNAHLGKLLRNINKIKIDAFFNVLRKYLTKKDQKVLDALGERTENFVANSFLSNFPAVFMILTSSIDRSLLLRILKIICDNIDSLL